MADELISRQAAVEAGRAVLQRTIASKRGRGGEMRLVDLYYSFTLNECNGTGYSLAFGGGFIDVYDPKGKPICQFWGGDAPTIDPASLRAKGEWISVEEKRPKDRQRCFIAYKFDGSEMRFFGEAMFHAYEGNGLVDRPHFSNEGLNGMYVTHWMAIPKLPNCGADMRGENT